MKKNVISPKFNENSRSLRYIRSFVRRHRHLTKTQQHAFDNYWPLIGIEFSEQVLDYSMLFGCTAPVILEIGFGMGTSLIEMAKSHPEKDFIGIEVNSAGVGACLAMAYKEGVDNVRIIYHDAIEVLYKMIPNNSLSTVQLFFPDPWHKTRHNKRRIIQVSFAELVKNKLNIGGVLHIATDWKPYAEYILKVISSLNSYKNQSSNNDYVLRLKTRPITKFEQRGLKLGHNIWDLIFERIK